ncbi:F-box protein FBW2-like [Triticum dicoccoides]|uniref:F-box protein FBW2-like n=1 Tax=Triticum dicoccoides TaxID=85692 RepID=UPI000E7B3FFB|nr:F-box protein FBW2-like [Triticum dicoccoides]
MKRRNPTSGAGFPRGEGPGWEAKRERPNGGWRGRLTAPVVKWSHAEAMKKKPKVGGGAALVADGGGWRMETEAEMAGLDGRSCGRGGFLGTSWSEAAENSADAATGGGENEWCLPQTEKATPCEAVEGGGGGDVRGDEVKEELYDWRWTEAASPEIMALILRGRFAADEIARGPAAVCRAWREAAASPDMWGDVDIEAWCRRVKCRVKADAAVRRLVARSQGTIRRLSAYRVGDAALAYVAASGKLLNVLQIPMSEISDQAVEKYVKCFPALRVLDISYCEKVTSRGMEAIGRQCKSLAQLKRNMPPEDNNAAPKVVEDEALAVANTMPMLKQLELAYGLFSDVGLDAILTKCPLLRTLDILGSLNVRLDGDIEERCCALESFREPWEPDYHENSCSGGDYDYDDTESDD